MNISDVIAKVIKLLSLSTSSNANEAANATSAANKLIDAYRLSQADLENHSQVTESVVEDDEHAYVSGRVTRWKEKLLQTLASHYGAVIWNDCHYPSGRLVTRHRLVGRRSDIEVIKFLFAYISSECQRLCDLEGKGKGKVFCNSYCIGFVNGIALQLQTSRVEVAKEATESALIKINQREFESNKFLMTLHPNLKTKTSTTNNLIDSNALGKGLEHGKNFHLGKNLTVKTTKLLK